jgi:hypothetical protein
LTYDWDGKSGYYLPRIRVITRVADAIAPVDASISRVAET